jgi:hypothetical protein
MLKTCDKMKTAGVALSIHFLAVLAAVAGLDTSAPAAEPLAVPRKPVRTACESPTPPTVSAPSNTSASGPVDGFWKVLVKPKARWVLKSLFKSEGRQDQVIIETYDVRKLGGADVARLRWTHVWGKGKKGRGECDTCAEGLFTQLAVTPAGLYILDARMTDAAVESALKGKPSRSEPPMPYKATKQNEGRYLRREDRAGESLVCMGWEALPGAPACDDTCFGELCISAKNGPVDLNGTWAPENGVFVRDGYGDDYGK